jgi:hypothetical protein
MFKWHGNFIFQKRKEKPKHLKSTYLSNYLNRMKQKMKQLENAILTQKKIDQIMTEKIYL